MFNNTKKLEEQLIEQNQLIRELISEIKALQTHTKFIMDDIENLRNDMQRNRHDSMEQPIGNWKVERF